MFQNSNKKMTVELMAENHWNQRNIYESKKFIVSFYIVIRSFNLINIVSIANKTIICKIKKTVCFILNTCKNKTKNLINLVTNYGHS